MSKLINKTRLEQFATKLWAKIKGRYDNALSGATLSDGTSQEKKITFTRISGTDEVVNLQDYTRLQDRNEFKEDVSADNVAIADNNDIGTSVGAGSKDRSLGFRRLTTDSFSDGYVDHIRINIPNITANASATSRWYVWAIKKGATDKNGDTVTKVICNNTEITVDTINENSVVKKFVKIPVKDSFENGTYFIVRCATHELEIVERILPEYSEDVVNMNNSQPPTTTNTQIDWNAGVNSTNNTAIMHLYGRESIGSLSLKLKKTQADSSLYVKHSDCTVEGGKQTDAGKVVKLGTDGKLHDSLMPSIAINEYIEVTTFDHTTLQGKRYENGDVVVVTSGGQVTKRYLCINKNKNSADLTEGFVELNSKDGVVQSVNGKVGAVELNLATTTDALKLTIGNGSGSVVEKSVDVITEGEITSMIENLQ